MARILIIACTVYSQDGRVRRHAEALARRGDEVDVFCFASRRIARSNGVNVIGLIKPRRHRLSRARYVRFGVSAALRAVRLGFGRPYDVVIVSAMRTAAILCAALPKLLGSRVMFDMFGTTPDLSQIKVGDRQSSLRARLLIMESAARARFADCAMVAHAIQSQRLEQAGIPSHKIRVVLDAPDPAIFKFRQRNDCGPGSPFTIVSYGAATSRLDASVPPVIAADFGAMASILSIDLAIHAISLLWHRIPKLRLIVIGGAEDYITKAKATTELLNLQAQVTFYPRVPLEILPGILQEATVGLVPNSFGSATHSVLPPELMQHATLGIPSIAARVEAIEHYFSEEAARFYEPGNAHALADAIEDLYEHPAVRVELACRARDIAASLSWAHQYEQYCEAIDSLLERESAVQRIPKSREWVSLRVKWPRLRRRIVEWRRSFGKAGSPAPILLQMANVAHVEPIILHAADAIVDANLSRFSACIKWVSSPKHVPAFAGKVRDIIIGWRPRLRTISAVRDGLNGRKPICQVASNLACPRCAAEPANLKACFCTKCGSPLSSSWIGTLKNDVLKVLVMLVGVLKLNRVSVIALRNSNHIKRLSGSRHIVSAWVVHTKHTARIVLAKLFLRSDHPLQPPPYPEEQSDRRYL